MSHKKEQDFSITADSKILLNGYNFFFLSFFIFFIRW